MNVGALVRRLYDRARIHPPGAVLVAVSVVVGVADLGALLALWEWVPPHLHSVAGWVIVSMAIVHMLPKHVSAVERAYRLGLRHGRREQRERCEALGHSPAEITGEMPAVVLPVAAGGNVVKLPEQRAARARARHRA